MCSRMCIILCPVSLMIAGIQYEGFPGHNSKALRKHARLYMEMLRSECWHSISYCCGWGWRVSRGPNPFLQAQLGGLRMVPVPWLTSSKPVQMSWSPPTHTALKKALFFKLSLDFSTKTKHSGDTSYHPVFVYLISHLLPHVSCSSVQTNLIQRCFFARDADITLLNWAYNILYTIK